MKILLANKFHYQRSGSEKVYFFTKKILEEHGHEVICFSMKDEKNIACPEEKYFINNIDFTSFDSWWGKLWHYLYSKEAERNIEDLIIETKPDIVHLHNFTHQLTASILKPIKSYGIPVVQTLHDYQLLCPNYKLYTKGRVCERCKKHKYYHCAFNRCVQDSLGPSILAALDLAFQWIFQLYREKIDLFISPSVFLKNKLVEWGVTQKVEVLPNALNLTEYEPRFEAGEYILCVSRLSREKGLKTLIQAIRKLPMLHLKIVGFGPDKRRLREYMEKRQVRNVELLGAKYGEELTELIKNSSFAVVPSEWYENGPISVLEAMAYGKPVLAASIGGLKEMVTENYNGWHFESGNIKVLRAKIREIVENTYQIEQFGRNARKTVEQKNCSEKYYADLIKYYNSVLPAEKYIKLG